MTAAPVAEPELKEAFATFNQLSQQLSSTYETLAYRVTELTEELSGARAARLQERSQKETLANRLEHLLAVLPAGVVVVNAQGGVESCNAIAQRLLGDPLVGCAWSEVIARAFAPQPGDGHEISLKSGARVRVATQSLNPFPGQLVLLTDMTETHALQDKLNAQARLVAMGETAASLAHQVRTPLATALLYVSQLEMGQGQPEKVASKVRERLHHLEHLVNDMLRFARGDRQNFEPLTVGELTDAFANAVDGLLHASRGALTVVNEARDLPLQANRDELLGALTNLVANAIDAKGEGVALVLHAHTRGGHVELALSDNGPGIAPELQEKIFEPFFTTRTTGTGLGLAVVRSVVRAHGGEVSLTSRAGLGATFTLRLPITGTST